MKKLFVSILALAAFAACQSDFNDVNFDAPQGGSNVNVGGAHTVYAEVGVGEEDTKATYGDGLKATWEESDQLALLQEHADYGTTFSVVNKLNIKEGAGTSFAKFNGDISVDATSPRVYHIAYPASAVSFNTTMSQEVTVESDNYHESTWQMGQYSATGYATCTYNSTLSITVPTTQKGKWEPYMYASTSEAVNSEAIGAKTLNTLTGAIAIRAFEANGKTPKQLKQITITSSDAAIAGAFSGAATSVGNTVTVTGAATDGHYTESVREENARKNLQSALQGYEATSTSVTKAMSLSFNGTGKSITATNLETIAADAKGVYTYHINVAPATLAAGTLTIVAVDTDGSSLTRVVDKDVVIAASHRAGFNLTWESATLKGATIESWYENWNTGSQFQLAGNTLYVDNIIVDGNIAPENVKIIGIKINDVLHEDTAQSGVKELSPIVLSGMTSGVYKVQPVAQVELNGELKWLEGGEVTKTITSIPSVTDYSVRTSYSSNGSEAKTNDINGDVLKVKANISDSYVANNLVNGKSYTICYGNNTATHTLGAEWTGTLAHTAWGQYVCYVKISLANGYVVESTKYTTCVTGIPSDIKFFGSNLDNIKGAGWNLNGSYEMSNASTGGNFLCLYRAGGAASSKVHVDGFAVTPRYRVPASTNVAISISHKDYYAGSGKDMNVYVGVTSSASSAASSRTTYKLSKTTTNGEGGRTTTNGEFTLDASNQYISIDHDDPVFWGSTIKYLLHSYSIDYKL